MSHSIIQASQSTSSLSSSITKSKPEYLTRANYPRQLIYRKETGDWEPTTEVKILTSIQYLAVSYRQSSFPDKKAFEYEIRHICKLRQLLAYWLDFACIGGTQDEKNEDLYRIADVFREAKETVIMIPDKSAWTSWGERVWTYPEALLSKVLLCKEGTKWTREITLREVANLAYNNDKEEENRLVALYGTSGKDFCHYKDRLRDLCLAIWSRSSGSSTISPSIDSSTSESSDGLASPKALPGERVYALMGFLQYRIMPNPQETEKEAFEQLLLENGLIFDIYPWEAVRGKRQLSIRDRPDNLQQELKIDTFYPKHIAAARYDNGQTIRKMCESGTRVKTLEDIFKWLGSAHNDLDSHSQNDFNEPVFWLHGLAGSGKSTISQTAAKRCYDLGILGSTFFCSKSNEDCSDIINIIPHISSQLSQVNAQENSQFRDLVLEAMRKDPDIQTAQPSKQMKELIIDPLLAIINNKPFHHYVIIIDALDECVDENPKSVILEAINEHISQLGPLKLLITSQPDYHIRKAVTMFKNNCRAYNLDRVSADADIRLYLQRQLIENCGRSECLVSENELDALVGKAGGLFIFASTAINFVEDKDFSDPKARLKLLLTSNMPTDKKSPYAQLDELYLTVLQNTFDEPDSSFLKRMRLCFGVLFSALEPLSIIQMSWVTKFNTISIRDTFCHLQSMFSLPDSDDKAIRLIHPSLRDFSTNEKRCKDKRYIATTEHLQFARCCIERITEFMNDSHVQQLLYNFQASTQRQRLQVKSELRKFTRQSGDAMLKYSFSHWMNHIRGANINDDLLNIMMNFISDPNLHNSLRCTIIQEPERLSSMEKALEKLRLTRSQCQDRFNINERSPSAQVVKVIDDHYRSNYIVNVSAHLDRLATTMASIRSEEYNYIQFFSRKILGQSWIEFVST